MPNRRGQYRPGTRVRNQDFGFVEDEARVASTPSTTAPGVVSTLRQEELIRKLWEAAVEITDDIPEQALLVTWCVKAGWDSERLREAWESKLAGVHLPPVTRLGLEL